MESLYKLLSLLNTQMAVPAPYSAFHVFFMLASVVAGFQIAKFAKNKDGSFIRRFLLIAAVLSIGLEVYKQINFSFRLEGGRIDFDYQWYAFPFQFCSTPMYVALLAAIVRGEKLHRRLCAYLASYSLFAGICVMLYPVSVFTGTLGINVQTMVCHGAMVTMGIVLLKTGYVHGSLKTLGRAASVFLTLILCAITMNELAYRTGLLNTETFNMFFISPYCAPELPVYSMVQKALPGLVSILVYIAGFTAAAAIVLFSGKMLGAVCSRVRSVWHADLVMRRYPVSY